MFQKIIQAVKKDILGEDYELSIAKVSAKKSREINKKYRNKDRPTNVLSFALSKSSGELILCPEVIRKEGWNLGFLVIHGMLHLKGMQHSSTMERLEQKYATKYFSGNRLGLRNDARSRRRILKGRKKS